MPSRPLPATAAWRHVDARDGFEVCSFTPPAPGTGLRVEGCTAATEDGRLWSVEYALELDTRWRTREARVSAWSPEGRRRVVLEGDGDGGWWVDGHARPDLSGCLDVDLESSAMTNTFPVHRFEDDGVREASVPAVYVRACDLSVERLEQHYRRATDEEPPGYDYAAPAFGVMCRLVYDRSLLVLDYPGLALRVV